MLNKISVGKYYHNISMIHDMNCIIKLLCTLIYAILCFISYSLNISLLMVVLVILLVLLSGVPISLYLKPIWQMKWFMLIIFVINIIFNDITYTSLLIIKILSVLTYTMMLTYTTKKEDMIYGLQVIFSPLKVFKIPVNRMAFSLTLAIRFIPDLLNTYDNLVKSQKNRGISLFRFDLFEKTINSLFVISMCKADT